MWSCQEGSVKEWRDEDWRRYEDEEDFLKVHNDESFIGEGKSNKTNSVN